MAHVFRQAAWRASRSLAQPCLVAALLLSAWPLTARTQGAGFDWREWREANCREGYRISTEVNAQRLRDRQLEAQGSGQTTEAWVTQAWISMYAAWADAKQAQAQVAQAEKALQDALAADNAAGAFELLLMSQWMRVDYLAQTLSPDTIALARRLAGKAGDDRRQGLIDRLEGRSAVRRGLFGEGLALYDRALTRAKDPCSRAQVLILIADALYNAGVGPAALKQASDFLIEARRLLPPADYPLFTNPFQIEAKLALQMGQPERAVQAARAALQMIQRNPTPKPTGSIRVLLAAALAQAGRLEAAREELRQISVAQMSSNVAVLYHLTQLEVETGLGLASLDSALTAMTQRIQSQLDQSPPARLQLHETLARIARLRGDAAAELREAVEIARIRQDIEDKANAATVTARLEQAVEERKKDLLVREAQDARQHWLLTLVALAALLSLLGTIVALLVREKRRAARLSAMADDLRATSEQLMQIRQLRDRMLAVACHDLRQPAHTLGFLTEAVRAQPVPPAAEDPQVHQIVRASESLIDMLNNLIDPAQLEGRERPVRLEPVRLHEVLQDLLSLYADAARRKGLGIAAAQTEVVVLSDKDILRRLLGNLVTNAIRYTDRGGIELSVGRADGWVCVHVTDTGPGIAPDDLERVFEDHVRLDHGKERQGLGIGLPIVRQLAQRLGHRVRLESTLGQGTTAIVSIQPSVASAAQNEQLPRATRRLTIGVMEDDPALLSGTLALLEELGYTAVGADSARELRAALLEKQAGVPQVVITDLHMRGLDGLDELDALRAQPGWATVRAILVTGDVEPGTLERALARQADYIVKPVRPRDLAARLQLLLQPATAD